MQIKNPTPISVGNQEDQDSPSVKIAKLQAELAVEKEDKLTIMEALASVYEELQAVKNGGTP